MKATISGLQKAQRKNLERIAAMKPSGRLGIAIRNIALEAHRYLVSITHVDTGSYRASQRINMIGLTATLNVDSSAVNPRTRSKPLRYSVIEEARGGGHAAYARTFARIKSDIARRHIQAFGRSLQ